MRLKLPVVYDGTTYQRILEYILWYDLAGKRQTSLSLLDMNSNSITRAPAGRVTLAGKEDTDGRQHQNHPAPEL